MLALAAVQCVRRRRDVQCAHDTHPVVAQPVALEHDGHRLRSHGRRDALGCVRVDHHLRRQARRGVLGVWVLLLPLNPRWRGEEAVHEVLEDLQARVVRQQVVLRQVRECCPRLLPQAIPGTVDLVTRVLQRGCHRGLPLADQVRLQGGLLGGRGRGGQDWFPQQPLPRHPPGPLCVGHTVAAHQQLDHLPKGEMSGLRVAVTARVRQGHLTSPRLQPVGRDV
mmetsp:Transcript_6221/g.21324  ORF Transcript_6221/g.21324 Transcript_6221/m.21324 type:complete len:223 (+) Transcript_6221:867-1535(+)